MPETTSTKLSATLTSSSYHHFPSVITETGLTGSAKDAKIAIWLMSGKHDHACACSYVLLGSLLLALKNQTTHHKENTAQGNTSQAQLVGAGVADNGTFTLLLP